MSTEEAQEFSKLIAAKAAEKELRKQRYAEYQLKRQQITRYDLPRPGSIPVPQLEKPKEKKEPRPQSVLSNFGTPNYEEISTYGQRPPSRSRSVSAAPFESNKEKESQEARPKIPFSNVSAFQDYTSDMMRPLNNPWVSKERKTATPSCTKVAPLVYLSPQETPVEGQPMEMKGKRDQNGIIMSALDNTELIPENMSQIKNPTSPTEFTKRLQNGEALRVEPQGINLLKTLGFDAQEEGNLEPDFYMADGKGSKLSETHCMYTAEGMPEDNLGVLVRLDNLTEKYGTSIYLLDKRSGHLYVTGIDSYKRIEEKGLLYPSESMVLAGALGKERSEPQPSIQVSKIQATSAAESTRIPLRTSTDKREVSNQKELLTPELLLDMEQTRQYKEELKWAAEDMVQACIEKSELEGQGAEFIGLRALKAQWEFWELERKRDENRGNTERMKEEIKRMDQAVASSSKFMKELKGADTQYIAMGQAIADFWDTSDVPQDPISSNIPSYPSLESLDEESKDELTEAQYGYYSLKREIIMEKLAAAYEIYCTHLKEYEEADPGKRSQKYLLQYNDISNRLHGQFEVVTSMLALPFKESLFTYPTLDYIMDMVEQKDLSEKGRDFLQELMKEIEVKNAIAEKVLQDRHSIVANSSEMAEADAQHRDYQK